MIFFLELSNEGCLLLLLFTVLVHKETVKGNITSTDSFFPFLGGYNLVS